SLPSILERLNIPSTDWLESCCHIESQFSQAIGSVTKITELCESLNQRWMRGIQSCRRLFPA
ncbi:hypothetical protein QWI17_20135, partial [Gilvimarinus sp. SDUM040013]|nr:hypothetical protein [Gilvimarinus sp. SDUM040013]